MRTPPAGKAYHVKRNICRRLVLSGLLCFASAAQAEHYTVPLMVPPGTTDEFSVNERGRGSFLGRLAGIRIRMNNETIDGRVYDFEASHQGDGGWRIDRVANST